MKFPEVLKSAVIKNNKVYLKLFDIELYGLFDYQAFKHTHSIDVLTPAILRRLHQSQVFSREIWTIFKNSNKISYLSVEIKRRRNRSCY